MVNEVRNSESRETLTRHECAWLRDGSAYHSGDVIGYSKIPGPKFGQEIWIHNGGTLDRPDWRSTIYEGELRSCRNRHFRTAEDCLVHARKWCLRSDRRPSLRAFEWFKGHMAYAVDGLDWDAVIIETAPGEFRMLTTDRGRSFWHDSVWSSPEDALRF